MHRFEKFPYFQEYDLQTQQATYAEDKCYKLMLKGKLTAQNWTIIE